jgi:succinate dehydrogenase hydrophobic anchor subunit
MGGETGQLQWLTDEQVGARLAAYNGDGSLERDVKLLRDNASDLIESGVRDQFGKEAAERVKAHYAGRVDPDWVQAVAEYGRRIFREKTSVPQYVAARDRLISRVIGAMFERFAGDSDTLQRCVDAFQRLTTVETDIILAQVSLLEWLHDPSAAVPMALLVIVGFKHALDGMKVFIDDYVHEPGSNFVVNTLLLFLAVGGGALALFALARIAFGAVA